MKTRLLFTATLIAATATLNITAAKVLANSTGVLSSVATNSSETTAVPSFRNLRKKRHKKHHGGKNGSGHKRSHDGHGKKAKGKHKHKKHSHGKHKKHRHSKHNKHKKHSHGKHKGQGPESNNTSMATTSGSGNGATVKIINNCPSDTTELVVQLQGQTMKKCGSEIDCENLPMGKNAVFWINRKGRNDYGATTLAEITNDKPGQAWYDISRVKGWNYGIRIKPLGDDSSHVASCSDVNCADAYWLCDTSTTNLFSPNYKTNTNAFEITFCYDGPNSAPQAKNECRAAFHPRTMQTVGNKGPFSCKSTSKAKGCHSYPFGPDDATPVFEDLNTCSDVTECGM